MFSTNHLKKNKYYNAILKGMDEKDKENLMNMPKEKLISIFLENVISLWGVDGLYFLGIEKRFGNESATEIDKEVWSIMGALEGKRLKKHIEPSGNALKDFYNAMKLTGWYLYMENKDITYNDNYVEIKNYNCRIQTTRIKKNLGEFPCVFVRKGYLQSFAKEIDPSLVVKEVVCPPSKHPPDLWCDWIISKGNIEI